MTKSLLAGILVLTCVAVGGAASAQEKERAHAALVPAGWSGFYVGFNAGWGWSKDAGGDISGDSLPFGFQQCITAGVCPGHIDVSYDGFTGGAQAGYNWQRGAVVFGFEADINYANLDGESRSPIVQFSGATTFILSQKIDMFGTARARVGFTPTDRLLIYATGGLAFAHVESQFTVPTTTAPTLVGRETTLLAGATIGGGAEFGFGNGWSAKIEGLYYDLGKSRVTATNVTPFFGTADAEYRGGIIRAGVNRKLY